MAGEGGASEPTPTLILSEGIGSSLGNETSFLQRAALRLLTARTGSEALSLARVSDPCTLLLDYLLPDTQADEVCRRIRSSEGLGVVRVVIVSTSPAPDIEEKCRQAGCDLFVPGPIDIPDLLGQLARLLRLPERGQGRLPVVLSVSYGQVTSEFLGHSRDLGVGGIRVETAIPLRLGSYLNLKFFLEGEVESIVAPGQVVRIFPMEEALYDVGIRFLALPPEDLTRLRGFLTAACGIGAKDGS